jgi:hypothetical protein
VVPDILITACSSEDARNEEEKKNWGKEAHCDDGYVDSMEWAGLSGE